MRFLHAADLHLDSPLRAQALKNPLLAGALRHASRSVLARIVDLAIAEEVMALLLAGDVFDGGVVDVTSRAALVVELARLGRAGIPAVMIRGNHDALLDLERYGPIGPSVTVLTAARPTLDLPGVAIHGIGFETRHVQDSLLPRYPRATPGVVNLGLMHTSLGGSPDHDPYAPCAEADLLGHGYDYWALGHIHQRFERRSDSCLAVMPGIPQGRSIRETAGGSVTLVDIGLDGIRATPLAVDLMRFATVTVDLAGAGDAARAISDALLAARPADAALAARVVLTGAAALAGDRAYARALVEQAAEALPDVHIETVQLCEVGPHTAPGVLADLAAMMQQDAASPGVRDEAAAALDDWRRALPRDVAHVLSDAVLDELMAEGRDAVVHRLARAAGRG
ncbi:DNA repair exonuclease SbcCD nuclease subunit [Loktanella fryxellensis]|uniref:DNA repair exonuclease SbcCD nuclease subunit n=1 Tax=Loktanella fryxellensis TaxID=245187 RepID=A0A1H7ZSE3_9RHOB|nr:DNA repair exonuclease [Loktanella fryxellensis]SEM61350.1 DNA repair exonuclease SbcCD nuclease subunit [Loktanella fryxellensis]